MITLPAPVSTPLRPTIHPLRILYAEDLQQLREFTSLMLGKVGHLIETANDGIEALEWLTRAPAAFDLLITDHHMPRMNGLELVQCVRTLPFRGKIIVFSSELNEAVHDQYRQLGVDLILPKPIFPVTLRRMLDELFTPGTVEADETRPDLDLVLA